MKKQQQRNKLPETKQEERKNDNSYQIGKKQEKQHLHEVIQIKLPGNTHIHEAAGGIHVYKLSQQQYSHEINCRTILQRESQNS